MDLDSDSDLGSLDSDSDSDSDSNPLDSDSDLDSDYVDSTTSRGVYPYLPMATCAMVNFGGNEKSILGGNEKV